VIKNKYVMLAKLKLGEYGRDIRPGKYAISPSMTYDEILKVLTSAGATSEEEEEVRDASKIGDTGKVATETPTTEEGSTESTEENNGNSDTDGGNTDGGEE
jgi:cell division protein YceG involved in septum cleavage